MTDTPNRGPSRRDVLKTSGKVAVASTLAGLAIPHVHAAENNTIQLALVGCGGRGTGAAEDALSSKFGPTKLVAMADVFTDRLKGSYDYLKKFEKDKKVEVPDDRKFIGFDAYKHAMDCLRPGDIVILTTPPAFRWVHFTYAIQKGLNVFMEKPITVDGPSTRRMLKLAEEAKAKNLKVGVGLMCRHCHARQELYKRIRDGQIGDLTLLRAYRQHNPVASFASRPKPQGISELLYQIRRFHSFLWASGGCYSDFYIHHIDECCWMKDAWPVTARGAGGRHYHNDSGGTDIDQNFDVYSVEYTFADGAKLWLEGRCMTGCEQEVASYAHGTKGSAIISVVDHWPSHARTFKDQNCLFAGDSRRRGRRPRKDNGLQQQNITWQCAEEQSSDNPYRVEWDDLLQAIREDKPYSEVERGAMASIVTAMGRKAAHTGQIVALKDMLEDQHEFAPEVDRLKMDSPAPLLASADGRYPVPEPGRKKDREF
ncbi:MAG TPA: Gfo/Idh/MocA family oxidoreductase [Gemmataceae bacterium]|nr:Gfo/Idh/MocA family oxidoreductase [Gemmataceae bacterium]